MGDGRSYLWKRSQRYQQQMATAHNLAVCRQCSFWHGAIYKGDLILENITKDYDEGGFKNAIKVSIKFKEAKTVQSSFVRVQHVGPITPPSPPGLWVTVVAGNTYWGWWKQYGTPIQTLRNWNKWPDRRIPIGARARVK